MPRVYTDAYASLRVWGPELDPLTVTLALRLPPDTSHRNGEPRIRREKRTGKVREYAPYDGGLWSMSSKAWVHSPRLAVHLDWLLAQVEPRADVLRALMTGGVEVDLFCFSMLLSEIHVAIS